MAWAIAASSSVTSSQTEVAAPGSTAPKPWLSSTTSTWTASSPSSERTTVSTRRRGGPLIADSRVARGRRGRSCPPDQLRRLDTERLGDPPERRRPRLVNLAELDAPERVDGDTGRAGQLGLPQNLGLA